MDCLLELFCCCCLMELLFKVQQINMYVRNVKFVYQVNIGMFTDGRHSKASSSQQYIFRVLPSVHHQHICPQTKTSSSLPWVPLSLFFGRGLSGNRTDHRYLKAHNHLQEPIYIYWNLLPQRLCFCRRQNIRAGSHFSWGRQKRKHRASWGISRGILFSLQGITADNIPSSPDLWTLNWTE